MWVGRKQCVPDRRERSCREGERASESGSALPLPRAALAAPSSKYYTLARLQGKARRLVGCGSGGNSACPTGGSGVAGRESARAREGPPCPSPRAAPCRPLLRILNPGSIAGHNDEAGGVWVWRKQCVPDRREWGCSEARPGGWWCVGRAETVRAAGGSEEAKEREEREKREFLPTVIKIVWAPLGPWAPFGAQGRGPACSATCRRHTHAGHAQDLWRGGGGDSPSGRGT